MKNLKESFKNPSRVLQDPFSRLSTLRSMRRKPSWVGPDSCHMKHDCAEPAEARRKQMMARGVQLAQEEVASQVAEVDRLIALRAFKPRISEDGLEIHIFLVLGK